MCCRENFTLSKTEEYGSAIDSEVPTNELGSDEEENRSDDGEGTGVNLFKFQACSGHIMGGESTRKKKSKRLAKERDLKPLTGFAWVDARYLYPFFTRRVTREELAQNRHQMRQLTSKWYQEVSEHHHGSDCASDIL